MARTDLHTDEAGPAESPSSPPQSPPRPNLLWTWPQYAMQVLFTVGLRYRARGVERVPKTGGGLLLCNHQSSLDPFLVGLPLPRPVSYLARDSLFRLPLIGRLMRHNYVIPISRESAATSSVRAAVERLRRGLLVGLFPEGTRSRDGRVGAMKPGFVALVRRGNVPVIPVGIAGAHEVLPRGAWLPRPRTVRVVFGPAFLPSEIERLTERGREEEFVALVRERIEKCRNEADAWRKGT
ncbi:MAG: lysophospholipid acyltransferase family protein [Planctomycetaceae bacterium]